MNAITKSIFAYLSILSLFTLDLAARGGAVNRGGGGGGGRPTVNRANVSRPAPSRPAQRPASSGNRSPITGTNLSRPAAAPSRPAAANRPAARPAAPAARPNPQPDRPNPQPRPNPGAGAGNAVNRPDPKPAPRPEARPDNRPATLPGNVSYPKPGAKPAPKPGIGNNGPGAGNTRPAPQPGNRPGGDNRPNPNPPGKGDRPVTLPGNRPGDGPGGNRPGNGNRPVTLPAQRPGRPGNPGLGNHRPETRPAPRPSRPGENNKLPQRPNFDRPTTLPARVPGDRPGAGNRPGGNNNWWNSGNINSGNVTINNNNNVNINNNFRNNLNWSTNQQHWGYNPWWNRPATHPWYGGCWNHGWHGGYYGGYYRGWYGYRPPGYYWDDDNDVAEAIGWGLVGWGLGALCFSSGYNDYHNPYPAPPVTTRYSTQVTYTQPITVVASEVARTEPAKVETMVETSASQIQLSQEAFRQGNYLAALESANAAIADSPGDGALHEYRALVLFALGKYSEAAGVLNPVLAGGPGWDWTTMVKLYDNQETYAQQLASLEAYTSSKTDAADARFLLGYHYMVCGHVEQAAEQFRLASQLQPQDSVSKQLYNLCSVTADDQTGADQPLPEDAVAPAVAPESVPLDKLDGKWVVDKGDKGVVTLTMDEDGKFTWQFSKDGKTDGFSGDYSMNDDGLLVLDSDQAQMVATVALKPDDTLSFVIAGGPPGDAGLQFSRKS